MWKGDVFFYHNEKNNSLYVIQEDEEIPHDYITLVDVFVEIRDIKDTSKISHIDSNSKSFSTDKSIIAIIKQAHIIPEEYHWVDGVSRFRSVTRHGFSYVNESKKQEEKDSVQYKL